MSCPEYETNDPYATNKWEFTINDIKDGTLQLTKNSNHQRLEIPETALKQVPRRKNMFSVVQGEIYWDPGKQFIAGEWQYRSKSNVIQFPSKF